MYEFFDVLNGWVAHASRWPVLAQLFSVLLPPLFCSLWSRYWPKPNLFTRHSLFVGPVVSLFFIVVLSLFGAPTGLARFLFCVYLGWLVLSGLRDWLETRVDSRLLAKIDTEIARPLLLILAAYILLDKVGNPDQLSVIPLVTFLGTTLTVGQAALSLLAIYIFVVASLPTSFLMSLFIGRVLSIDSGSRRALSLIIRYSIIGAGVIWVLDSSGFNRTAILAIAGGLSVGLGFGVKEIFANFISGIWLLLEGKVRPGERIFIDGDACEVQQLGLRAAMLWRDRDNTELLVPNQILLTTTTTAFTCQGGIRQCEVEISASYKHEPREILRLLVASASEVRDVLADPAPSGLVVHYGESAIFYAVRYWIANPMGDTKVSSEVRLAIWESFKRHAIEIPRPQLVIHKA